MLGQEGRCETYGAVRGVGDEASHANLLGLLLREGPEVDALHVALDLEGDLAISALPWRPDARRTRLLDMVAVFERRRFIHGGTGVGTAVVSMSEEYQAERPPTLDVMAVKGTRYAECGAQGAVESRNATGSHISTSAWLRHPLHPLHPLQPLHPLLCCPPSTPFTPGPARPRPSCALRQRP